MAKRPSLNASTANLGFKAKLWQAADALRNNLAAAEYKYVDLSKQRTTGASCAHRRSTL
jgi:hypothetical protein